MGKQKYRLGEHKKKSLEENLSHDPLRHRHFIEALKSNPRAMEELRGIGFQNIALSSMSVMELYFGAIDKRELRKIKSRLQTLEILTMDRQITEGATFLIEKYARSHGLHIPDALIAATAICRRMELLAYNLKDLKFIDGIGLYDPDKNKKTNRTNT